MSDVPTTGEHDQTESEAPERDDDAKRRADKDVTSFDPDAPGNFLDDEESDEIPEPNEPG